MKNLRLLNIVIIVIFIFFPLFFTSCKFESLGLSLDSKETRAESAVESEPKYLESAESLKSP